MNNLRKKVIAFAILVSMLFTQGSVFAAGSLRYSHTTYKKAGYNRDYGYHTYFARTYLGDNIAYCVDYGRRNPAQGTNLPEGRSLSNKSLSVLLNGYPYKSAAQLGVASNDEAYYATQLAFWIAARGESKKKPLNLNLNNITPASGMQTFYNNSAAAARRILAAAESNPYSYAKPTLSLDGSNAKLVQKDGKLVAGPYTVNGSNLKEAISLSLENAPASAKLSKTTVNPGEQVYVEMSQTEQGSTLYINAKSAGARYEGKVYETSPWDMQDFALAEKIVMNVSDKIGLKWNTIKGNINVLKVDQNNDRIKGVVFELQDMSGNKIAEGTTNDNGIVSFTDVTPGKYKLVETKAPNGYIKGDKPLEFVVETGKTFQIKVENIKMYGKLKVIKTDNINKTPIKGVEFEIFDENRQLVDTIVTDAKGEALSAELPLGKYTFRESKVPNGIVLDQTLRNFEITAHEQVIVKNVVNRRVMGKLHIIKTDDYAKKPIAGVKFEILDSNKNVVDTIVTDANGKATSKDLVYGKYTYREVEVPNDIVLDKTEYPFVITEDGKTIVKEIVNTKIKGQLQILKVDSETKQPLEGVKFQILDSNKNVVETIVTNENGIAKSSVLVKGKYFYKEVEAKDGYVTDDKEHEFSIMENGKVVEKTVENTKIKGKLKIVKTEDFFKKPLAGVKFQILDSDKKVVDEIVTDKDGIAVSKDLTKGKYTYKEVEVPDDIVIDETEYPFEVVENNKVIVKKIVNTKIKGSLEILKLDKDTKLPIPGVEFKVMDKDGNVIETIVTNNEGVAKSSTLLKGEYKFVETKAASGYVIENTEFKFKISKNNDLAKQTVFNSKKTLPVTGNGMGTNAMIFTAIATITVAAYISLRKIFN